jgi:hypothetical protein
MASWKRLLWNENTQKNYFDPLAYWLEWYCEFISGWGLSRAMPCLNRRDSGQINRLHELDEIRDEHFPEICAAIVSKYGLKGLVISVPKNVVVLLGKKPKKE